MQINEFILVYILYEEKSIHMYEKIVYYVFKYFTLKLSSNENCENALNYFFLSDSFLAYVFYIFNSLKGFLWGKMSQIVSSANTSRLQR